MDGELYLPRFRTDYGYLNIFSYTYYIIYVR